MSIAARLGLSDDVLRREKLSIRFDIPAEKIDCVKPQLEVLDWCAALNMPYDRFQPGDTAKVNYTITCEYIGNTAMALTAVNEICRDHPELIEAVEMEELVHGKMLLHEAMCRLDALMETVKKRPAK